jgi:hypothetical protein
VVAAIETAVKSPGGRFSDPNVRADFKGMIDRFRSLLADLRVGANIERNIVGQRDEILAVFAWLEAGGEVFAVGPVVKVRINPALFELPREYKLINAREALPLQMDVGTKTVNGRLVLVETTTGELSLPEALKGLDPQGGLPSGGTIDLAKLDTDIASHRKFIQMIKIRAAAKFAMELSKAFYGLTGSKALVQLPEMVIRVPRSSAPARRVAEGLEFRVEVTGGE